MGTDHASILAALLAAYPDLDAAAAQALIGAGHVMNVPAGQKCPTCCGSVHEIMWLLEGSIRIYRQAADGREVTLCHVTPGDLCPLSLYTMFHGGVYAAEARTETRLHGIVVPSQEMHALVDRNPKIRQLLLKHLTGRMHELSDLVSASVLSNLELRLACLLGQRFGQSQGKSVNITHQELANDLGCTREVISRLLKGFERMGCIQLHRGEIELLSQEALTRLTESRD